MSPIIRENNRISKKISQKLPISIRATTLVVKILVKIWNITIFKGNSMFTYFHLRLTKKQCAKNFFPAINSKMDLLILIITRLKKQSYQATN